MQPIFTLLRCPVCDVRFAALPHPRIRDEWVFFDAEYCDLGSPTHTCCGGLLCVRGHTLEVLAFQAVQSRAGVWLDLEHADTPVRVN